MKLLERAARIGKFNGENSMVTSTFPAGLRQIRRYIAQKIHNVFIEEALR